MFLGLPLIIHKKTINDINKMLSMILYIDIRDFCAIITVSMILIVSLAHCKMCTKERRMGYG